MNAPIQFPLLKMNAPIQFPLLKMNAPIQFPLLKMNAPIQFPLLKNLESTSRSVKGALCMYVWLARLQSVMQSVILRVRVRVRDLGLGFAFPHMTKKKVSDQRQDGKRPNTNFD